MSRYTDSELLVLRGKLRAAVAYGIRKDGNLQWAEYKLAGVERLLAARGIGRETWQPYDLAEGSNDR